MLPREDPLIINWSSLKDKHVTAAACILKSIENHNNATRNLTSWLRRKCNLDRCLTVHTLWFVNTSYYTCQKHGQSHPRIRSQPLGQSNCKARKKQISFMRKKSKTKLSYNVMQCKDLSVYRIHKPFANVPSHEGNTFLGPLRLHMHTRVPIKPTICKIVIQEK